MSAHDNPKYNAVYGFLCELAERGLPCPSTQGLAVLMGDGYTQFSVNNALHELRKCGAIRTGSEYTGYGRRYRLVEIVASGKRIGHPSNEVQDLPSAPSDESAGGPRVVSAIDRPILDASLKTAPEPAINGHAPAPSSPGFTGWPKANHSLAAERQRAVSKARGSLTPRVLNTALSGSDRCQFPTWPDGATFGHRLYGTYCGEPRCGENNPYCREHFERSYSNAAGKRLSEAPGEILKRIERGRKIRAGHQRAKALRQHQAQQGAA